MSSLGHHWKLSEETKQKMRKPKLDSHREAIRQSKIGNTNGYKKGEKKTPFTEEHCRKLSLARLGKEPWNKGEKVVQLQNEKHFAWKGDEVGYIALHTWVARKLGKPCTCEHCGRTGLIGHKIQWANKSGKYLRDLNDWLRLCVPCHRDYDAKLSII